ncbi:MAG: hypothetical protein R3350_04350 [Saprospiraceae bacterium]|nr:hypothetical protein [Saprospiraceae bacterium]
MKKNPDAGYYPGRYYGYHSRFQYAYRPHLYLPGEGKVVSEKICRNPTIAKVCRQDYEIIPGAIWTYTYFSYTEKQVAQARAERFARQHNGLVEHEGTAYVVYKDVLDCEFAVTACESLVKNDETGDTASC